MLEVAVFSVGRLSHLSSKLHNLPASISEEKIGGGVFSGFTNALHSSYLLGICGFLLLYSVTSTFLYFEQAGIVSSSFADKAAQTEFFAMIDLTVNCLTLIIQLFLSGRIVVMLGVGLSLALVPLMTVIGFRLALAPTLTTVGTFQVLRRVGEFAITRPSREILYTVVSREDRYKVKNFIDTVVYRLGDQAGAWSVALVRTINEAPSIAALVAIPLALLWLVNGLWLGRREDQLAKQFKKTTESVH